MKQVTTVNPLTKKATAAAAYIPKLGDRIAFNPGRSTMALLYIGVVKRIAKHSRYGTLVDIRTDGYVSIRNIAVDHVTVKLISA
jgi:hypothetical protein